MACVLRSRTARCCMSAKPHLGAEPVHAGGFLRGHEVGDALTMFFDGFLGERDRLDDVTPGEQANMRATLNTNSSQVRVSRCSAACCRRSAARLR